ncbi:MAG TPA: response regulator [Opitutus sp.]|nr:response regulator [Opitutus sp.]
MPPESASHPPGEPGPDAGAAPGRTDLEVLTTDKAETLATFAGGVAHDFNNLLTGIMGYHELLACELDESTTAQDYIRQARQACLRARDLLDLVLSFARETSAAPHAAIGLGALLESIRELLAGRLPGAIAVDMALAADLPPVSGNAAQLRLALLNLCLHVARPLAAKGGSIRVRLRRAGPEDTTHAAFAALTPGPCACITVANTSATEFPGRPAGQKVFDRSFTIAEMREGDNLGVAVVFRIIRVHHGVVGWECAPGGGEEFRVYLPFPPSATAAAPGKSASEGRGSGELVYVVDDDETVVTVLRIALRALGYRVLCFGTPAECLESFQAAPPAGALLITDQSMPGITGVDLVARARALAPHLRAIIVTGNSFDLPPPADRGAPFDVIQKPFTADELAVAVQRILHRPAPAG